MKFRISDFGFRIFAAIVIAALFPHSAFSAEKKKRVAKSAPSFVATVNGHSISVTFIFGKFDPKKRVVTKRIQKNDASETYEEVLVNGKPVCGLDNAAPSGKLSETIEKIVLLWDDKMVVVPYDLFDHIVLPHGTTSLKEGYQPGLMFVVDPDGDAMVVRMGVGDGGGTSMIVWLFRKDGKHRILDNQYFKVSN